MYGMHQRIVKMILGLTGQTGAGKTVLSKIFYQHGYEIINADKIVHEIYDTQPDCLQALVRCFGNAILMEEKILNRKKLGEIVFSNEDKLRALESIVYPFVLKEISIRLKNKNRVLLDAPTLFESGANSLCDFTIAVLADKRIRCKRIQNRDCLREDEAMSRIQAQKEDAFYHSRADYILYNNTGLEDFYLMARERLAIFLNY